jgi:Ala-tRNA(Pro) deacylase
MTMTLSRKLAALLEAQHVVYRTSKHDEAVTSQEVARAAHVPGRKMAKVVALRDLRGRWLLAVVPAPCRVDLRALGVVSGQHELRLASEREIARRFPDCEPGAIPPFESLYHVPIFIDWTFADARDIFFEDGTHRGVVGMRVQDFVRTAEPIAGHFAQVSAVDH